jgi:hypothetical protein
MARLDEVGFSEMYGELNEARDALQALVKGAMGAAQSHETRSIAHAVTRYLDAETRHSMTVRGLVTTLLQESETRLLPLEAKVAELERRAAR